ncbi:MAG: hypothetical protein R6X02_34325 [Enhygromyxa sp.]
MAIAGLPAVELIAVRTVAAAVEVLDRRVPDLLVTALELDDGRGLDIVERLEQRGFATPSIIRAEPGEEKTVPPHRLELLLLDSADEAALRERISLELERRSPIDRPDPFGITDYLQLASFNRRSLVVETHLEDGRDGQIVVVDGEVWASNLSAASGGAGLFGVEAIAELVAKPVAVIEVHELREHPAAREITTPTQMLLLDLARILDEARRAEAPEASGVFAVPLEFDELDFEERGPNEEPEPEPVLDADEALRRLLSSLASDAPALTPEELALAGERRDRTWLRALAARGRPIEDEPGVVLVGFADAVGAALCSRLAELGIPAWQTTAAELAASATRPGLLVQRLEVEDDGPPFACFDLIWTLRASGRSCPWLVITDWPTRYTAPMCAALGALAWYGVELADAHEDRLAPEIGGWFRAAERPAMPERFGCLDLVLMLVDREIDATIELREPQSGARRGRIAVTAGELWAAEYEPPAGGELLRGIDAATALCRHEGLETRVLAPIPTRERNLPRGLALALAALTRGLPGPINLPSRAAQEHDTAMSSVNSVCAGVVEDLTDALACGVIDLNTGMLMGVHHTISYFTQSYLDAVAAAAVDMFRGKNVQRVEKLISKHRGEEVRDAFEEIFISSPAVFHFMKLIRDKSAVVVLVTRKSTNQGMGWSTLRLAVDDIAAALP